MINYSFSHVEYATADEIGEDSVSMIADHVGLSGRPEGRDFAVVCLTTAEGKVGYLTDDIEYARMLEAAHENGLPINLSDEVAQTKLPINRPGWPATWLGFDGITEQ